MLGRSHARRDPQRREFEQLAANFLEISRRLPEGLLTGDGRELQEREVLVGLGAADEDRLLGYYARDGIDAAMEAYGIYDRLRARGYRQFEVVFDLQPFHHGLRILGDGLVVADCRLRRMRGATDPCIAAFQRDLMPELMLVEWLALTDRRAEFGPGRPRLPGQTHPGTGIGGEVFILLFICARRLGLHGLIDVPERFHNAVIYRRRMTFIDPVFEGRFERLLSLINGEHTLSAVAWALEEGRVLDEATGEPVVWAPREQLLSIDARLEAYFELPAWRRARAEARRLFRPRMLPRDLQALPRDDQPEAHPAGGARRKSDQEKPT
jgi:hypothetical protein